MSIRSKARRWNRFCGAPTQPPKRWCSAPPRSTAAAVSDAATSHHLWQFSQQASEAGARLVDAQSHHDLPGRRDVGMHDRYLQVLLEHLDDALGVPGAALDIDAVRAPVGAKEPLDVGVERFRRDV